MKEISYRNLLKRGNSCIKLNCYIVQQLPKDNPVLNVIYKSIKDYDNYYLIGSNGTVRNKVKTMKTFIIRY